MARQAQVDQVGQCCGPGTTDVGDPAVLTDAEMSEEAKNQRATSGKSRAESGTP
jgi:hypothetical protein